MKPAGRCLLQFWEDENDDHRKRFETGTKDPPLSLSLSLSVFNRLAFSPPFL